MLPDATLEEIAAIVGLPVDAPPKKPIATLAGVTQGDPDAALFRYACRLRGRGLERAEVEALVLQSAACVPPFPVAAALRKVDAAFQYLSAHPLNDLGNARRFVDFERANVRYVPEFKAWLTLDAKNFWRRDTDGEIVRRAKDVIDTIKGEAKNAADQQKGELAQELLKHASRSGGAQRIAAMIELARTEPGIPLTSSALDQDPMLFGVANGVLDLRTGKLRPARAEDYITQRSPVVFDPAATCPTWEMFLQRVMGDDPELFSYIKRAVGYSLTGDTREHVFFFAHGSGANGKSTFTDIVQRFVGDYGRQIQSETLMVQKGKSASNDIARLFGARAVIASETEEGARLAEVMIKQATGGDTLTARYLYCEFFEFRPQFKLWIVGNHKPAIRGTDLGIWRRVHLIPFTVTIPPEQRDKALSEKLRTELPGILNWALEGCLEWQRDGLNPPATVTAATDEYRREMDVIGAWIDERCEVNRAARTSVRDLYRDYRAWAEDNGEHVFTGNAFGRKLGERFRKEKIGVHVWVFGLAVRPALRLTAVGGGKQDD